MKRKLERVGGLLVVTFLFMATFGPALAPHDPAAIDLAEQYATPTAAHWLGTADNGVDLLSALLHGARLAALVSFSVVGLSLLIGLGVGTLAGFVGGRLDHLLMGFADLVQAFPAIILNIAILALVARPGLTHLVFALVVSGWVLYARIARAEAMALRDREYVIAARALGATPARVVLRHVIPNLIGPLIIQATSGLGGVILAESTLSFLGLGPGTGTSWGALLDQGSSVLLRFPHVALVAGGAIALTVLGFHLTGDTLRDRFDPRA